MNVGILTFHFSENYGAALQAYALRRWFTERGHQAHFIDYRPAHIEHGGSLSWPTSRAKIKANLKVVYLAASSFFNEHFGNQSQKEKFARFRDQHLGVKNCATNNEMALGTARTFDLIVAGSDQIWSSSQHNGFDPNYFLAFARNYPCRRVSYAASFGRDNVLPCELAQLPTLLTNFDAVSIRETSGVSLVKQVGVRNPAYVPDPTILHNDYSALIHNAQAAPNTPFIFCYTLRSADNIRQTAELVSRELDGCPILSPHNPHRRWREIGSTVHPDPAEWLALLKSAHFVVTNSFHGTVFSLIFHKPFIVAGLTGEKATANARALNLLRSVGLESHFTESFSTDQIHQLIKHNIDWQAVDARLASLRKAGDLFLQKQILSTKTK